MSQIVSLPLGKIPAIFKRLGFSQDEMVCVLFGLIQVWRHNDHYTDMTVEYVFTEMDLDPLVGQILILEAGCYMTELGNIVRTYALSGRLIRWNVLGYLILLEIETDEQILQSYGECSASDGCHGDGESVPFPF